MRCAASCPTASLPTKPRSPPTTPMRFTAYRQKPLVCVLPQNRRAGVGGAALCLARGRARGAARRGHVAVGRRAAAGRRDPDRAVADEPHPRHRLREPLRRRRARRHQSRHHAGGGGPRILLCARSIQPDRLLDRRQRGREFRRHALPEIRHHLAEPAGRGDGAARRRARAAGRQGPWARAGSIFSAWSRDPKGCSASSSRRRCASCPSRPRSRRMLLAFASVHDAAKTVGAIIAAGIIPAAMEFMDQYGIRAAEAYCAPGYPADAAAILIVEVDGMERRSARCRRARGRRSRAAKAPPRFTSAPTRPNAPACGRDARARSRRWAASSPTCCAWTAPFRAARCPKCSTPWAGWPNAMASASAMCSTPATAICIPCIVFDVMVPGELEKAEEFGAEILRLCVTKGGVLSGEHGVGVEKKALMGEMFTDSRARPAGAAEMRLRRAGPAEPGQGVSHAVGLRRTGPHARACAAACRSPTCRGYDMNRSTASTEADVADSRARGGAPRHHAGNRGRGTKRAIGRPAPCDDDAGRQRAFAASSPTSPRNWC